MPWPLSQTCFKFTDWESTVSMRKENQLLLSCTKDVFGFYSSFFFWTLSLPLKCLHAFPPLAWPVYSLHTPRGHWTFLVWSSGGHLHAHWSCKRMVLTYIERERERERERETCFKCLSWLSSESACVCMHGTIGSVYLSSHEHRQIPSRPYIYIYLSIWLFMTHTNNNKINF